MPTTIKAAQLTAQGWGSPTLDGSPTELATYLPSGYDVAGVVSWSFKTNDTPSVDLPVVLLGIIQAESDADGAIRVALAFTPVDPDVTGFGSGEVTLLIDGGTE